MTTPSFESTARATPTTSDSAPPPRIGGGGCSAAERGAVSPVLRPGYTKPFRWEVVPEPNPDCAVVGAAGEADTRAAADADLRRALAGYAAGFGFLYEMVEGEVADVADRPPQVRELARIPIRGPDPKPPAW